MHSMSIQRARRYFSKDSRQATGINILLCGGDFELIIMGGTWVYQVMFQQENANVMSKKRH